MLAPFMIALGLFLVTPVLYRLFRIGVQMRFHRKVRRDFFQNRVKFVPAHPTPVAPPLRPLYNFIEADQFIAVLSDPRAALPKKKHVLETIQVAQGMIKRQQQAALKGLLTAMRDDPDALLSVTDGALMKLDQAALID
jgi:hypothetical protein